MPSEVIPRTNIAVNYKSKKGKMDKNLIVTIMTMSGLGGNKFADSPLSVTCNDQTRVQVVEVAGRHYI